MITFARGTLSGHVQGFKRLRAFELISGAIPPGKQIRLILDSWAYGSEQGIKVGGFWRWILTRLMKGGTRFCSGAGEEVSVSPEGELYSCHAQAEKIGDVYHFDKVIANQAYLRSVRHVAGLITECSGCRIEGMCCGGCVANFEKGDKYRDDKWCCFLNSIVDQFLDRLFEDPSFAGD